MGATGRHFSIVSNVMQQDSTECLSIFKTRKLSLDFINEKYDLNDEFESLDLIDDLSEAQNGCIKYISGFLVRKLKSSTKCNICLNTMLPSTENVEEWLSNGSETEDENGNETNNSIQSFSHMNESQITNDPNLTYDLFNTCPLCELENASIDPKMVERFPSKESVSDVEEVDRQTTISCARQIGSKTFPQFETLRCSLASSFPRTFGQKGVC